LPPIVRRLLRWAVIALAVLAAIPVTLIAAVVGFFALKDAMTPRPRAIEVDEIERRLSKIPCVGPLHQWQRTYKYDIQCWECGSLVSPRPRNLDRIIVEYDQAGLADFEDRRIITSGESLGLNVVLYHWNFETRGVSATYDISSDRLRYRCWTDPPSL